MTVWSVESSLFPPRFFFFFNIYFEKVKKTYSNIAIELNLARFVMYAYMYTVFKSSKVCVKTSPIELCFQFTRSKVKVHVYTTTSPSIQTVHSLFN